MINVPGTAGGLSGERLNQAAPGCRLSLDYFHHVRRCRRETGTYVRWIRHRESLTCLPRFVSRPLPAPGIEKRRRTRALKVRPHG